MTERRQPIARALPHRFAIRVYYEDTDAGGIVYYANYLKFAERARTEMLRDFGMAHAAMAADSGLMFAVRRCEVDYLKPARLDDALTVETDLADIGGATLALDQSIYRADEALARMKILLACIDRAGKPGRIPTALRDILRRQSLSEQRVS